MADVIDHAVWLRVFVVALLLSVASGSVQADGNSGVSREYQVKAAFLYNMPKFVGWPANSFATDDSPIVIGLFRNNPFGGVLDAIVDGRRINNRRIVVRRVATLEQIKAVQVLFVGEQEDREFGSLWSEIRKLPILVVGESEVFESLGGTIRFVPVGDKLRFEVNISSAEDAGLKISAQLLKLAAAVHRTP